MTAFNKAVHRQSPRPGRATPRVSTPLRGNELHIGDGFAARSFRAGEIGATMDPLVMVDHYEMSEPTFGVHPHAGLSALSLLFEDGAGRFHNRDTLGNDFHLLPGDLYWLKAGRGALHDEAPTPGSRIHGLQVFVNLPEAQRYDEPASLLVRSAEMPVLSGEGYRVRIALGESNGRRGVPAPGASMTVLDGFLGEAGVFAHRVAPRRNVWIHAIRGDLQLSVGAEALGLREGEALAVSPGADASGADLRLRGGASGSAHFVLFDSAPIDETYVQRGPFVMGSEAEIAAVEANYRAGRLGQLDEKP